MKAKKRNRTNRRKPAGGKRPFGALLLVVLLIVLVVLLLEQLRERMPAEAPASSSQQMERHKIPPRQEYHPVEQQPYTSSSIDSLRKYPRKKRVHGPGTVAIIVDDMGSSMQEVRALMAIKVPLTFSLIPGLARVRDVAEAARAQGYPVMIHIPMEPQGYPHQRLEANGLLVAQSNEEIARRMNDYIRLLPQAVGANNHMGSRFTEDRDKMKVVLNQLKAHSLFFVDSRTSPRSVGMELAHGMALDAAGRNVFLDNVQEVGAIRSQLEQVAALARKRGSAIAICHPHKATIQALSAALPEMQKDGINFVGVSELVR